MRFSSTIGIVLLLTLACGARVDAGGTPLTAVRVAQGVGQALYVTSPPNDFERLFIVQRTGVIRILNIVTGQLLSTAFLNISSQVGTSPNERGLLGLAFHPDYATNGFFYVCYTNTAGTSLVRRYTVSSTNPNVADTGSAFTILTQGQPEWNHNGGMIAFGPDGYLYIGFGDGGGGGDTFGNSQNLGTRLAKMLRIDVDGPDAFPSANDNFAIPPTNPFVGPGNPLDEIWALGLRNPWRWSFDRLTGDMWIADVGQGTWEEIDFQPASSLGGENYGWRCMEGNHCFGSAVGACTCNSTTLTDPIWEYSHSASRCSITGGYVYRGMAIPDLDGTYFYADYCTGEIWSIRYNGVSVTDFEARTAELDPPGVITIGSISSFGEDAMGELYIVDLGGEVFKIVPANIASLDCNGNFIVDSIEFALGLAVDCNNNSIMDACEITANPTLDCDDNGQIDACEFTAGTAIDCNANGVIDSCDIAAGTSTDCNTNGIVDSCELTAGTALDCNSNGVIDTCDIAGGLIDCNLNDIPDECELASGTEFDCNTNGILDTCDIAFGLAQDCNLNTIPDGCEIGSANAPDCNTNGVIDSCDIGAGTSLDANLNGIPDECEASQLIRGDCNADGSFNVADAVSVLDFLFGSTGGGVDCEDSCDVNDDGSINIADAVAALDGLFGGGNLPAAPHPTCGPDPTMDNLGCDQFSPCP